MFWTGASTSFGCPRVEIDETFFLAKLLGSTMLVVGSNFQWKTKGNIEYPHESVLGKD